MRDFRGKIVRASGAAGRADPFVTHFDFLLCNVKWMLKLSLRGCGCFDHTDFSLTLTFSYKNIIFFSNITPDHNLLVSKNVRILYLKFTR